MRYSSSSKACKGSEKLVVATTYRVHGPRPHGQPATLGLFPLVLGLEVEEKVSDQYRLDSGGGKRRRCKYRQDQDRLDGKRGKRLRMGCSSSSKACRKACCCHHLPWSCSDSPLPSGPLPLVSRWRPGSEGASISISISSSTGWMVGMARGEGYCGHTMLPRKGSGGGERQRQRRKSTSFLGFVRETVAFT